jgi:hypothetical protein
MATTWWKAPSAARPYPEHPGFREKTLAAAFEKVNRDPNSQEEEASGFKLEFMGPEASLAHRRKNEGLRAAGQGTRQVRPCRKKKTRSDSRRFFSSIVHVPRCSYEFTIFMDSISPSSLAEHAVHDIAIVLESWPARCPLTATMAWR